ncbi:hypothetical protein TREVI0001_2415 [Treponema vincentii ATCC 35580]|uniref:Uncharacterized protein n=1 Tax=Treponema vincentii ATCC 35580 TaxID=596324 RepID=C8PSM6_9SPIR|nr:Ig-like domain repeat protein [Treponema vincentii]EEV19487.1 hypothetical protein TREVI0001_2415 [Treponema vincentii ATCC 35580]
MKKNRIASFALIVLTAVAGLTCRPNIGLGGQIDILPPEGEITYPDAGETPIRGSFVLKGTASDDDGIQSITVVFENIETQKRSRMYKAEGFTAGSASASWTVTVENEATETEPGHELVKIYPIPDGEYTAILTVTDKGGKSTAFTKNYKIDNTPPVFLVSRPSTIADATGTVTQQADKYGAVFSVVGEAGEKNTVEKLTVSVPGAEQATMTSKFVGTNINAKVAVYTETPPTNPLYDLQEQDKTQPIRGQLYLYDNAREYKGGDPSGEGNKAEWFYLWDKIYDDVIAKGYTPEVISDYFSGKKGSDANDHEKKIKALRSDTTALNTLKTERVNMDKQRSIFRLDPKKSPGFKVIGIRNLAERPLNVSKASSMLFKSGDETSFIVELIRNKDNTPLVKDNTLEAYKNSNIEIVLLKWDGTGTENESFVTGEHLEEIPLLKFADLKEEDASRITVEGGNLRVKCTFTTLTEGAYAVNVKGTDTSGEASSNSFAAYDDSNSANGGLYIVNFLAVGNGPRIRPVRPQGFKNTTVDIEADVSGIENGGTVYYVIKKKQKGNTGIPSDGPYPPTTLQKVSASEDTVVPRYKAVIDIPASATFDQQPLTDGDYEVYFLVKADSGATDRDSTDFTVDRTAPTVELTYPDYSDPQAGEITVSGSITDVGAGVKAESTKYILGKKPSTPSLTDSGWLNMTTSTKGSWNVDVDLDTMSAHPATYGTQVGTSSYYKVPLYIRTEDMLGNATVHTKEILFNSDGTKPVVRVLSPQADAVVGGTIQIFGTASAVTGGPSAVGEVYVQFSHDGSFANTSDGTFGTTVTTPPNQYDADWYQGGDGQRVPGTGSGPGEKGSDWRLEINGNGAFNGASQRQDVYFRFRAKNKNNNRLGEWTTPIKIIVDKDAPVITDVKIDNASGASSPQNYETNMWIGSGKKLTAKLTDPSGIKEVKITSSKMSGGISYTQVTAPAGWLTPYTASGVSGYTLSIPLDISGMSGNDFSIKVEITENTTTGLKSDSTFTFRFDTIAPKGFFGSGLYINSGYFGDSSVTNAALADKLRDLGANTSSGAGCKILADNTELTVTSISGSTVSFTPSTTAKEYNYILYKSEVLIHNDGTSPWIVNGVANDDGSGIAKVEAWVKVDSTETTHTTITETDNTNKITRQLGGQVTWKGQINLSSLKDGKGTLHYKITDKSGNTYTASPVDVRVKNKPIKVSKITLATKIGGSDAEFANDNVNKALKDIDVDANLDFTANYTSSAFAFKDKDNSKIKVNFTGGEGTVKYRLRKSDGTMLQDLTAVTSGSEIDLTPHFGTGSNKINNSNGTPTTIKLELWDEAHGYTQGTDSAWAKVDITTLFDALDTKPPTVVILPFHWNGEGDNSLYQNNRANGHVEIAKINSLGNDYSSVSGKVTLRGFAYDNVQLKTLTATLPNASNITVTNTNNTWSIGEDTSKNIKFKVEESKYDYLGYYVKWKLEWDSEKTSVGLGKTISVSAHDGTNSSGTSAADPSSSSSSLTRDTNDTAEHADFAGAKPGQFILFTKGEAQHLTRVKSVTGNKIELINAVDTGFVTATLYKDTTNNPSISVNVVPYITSVSRNSTYNTNRARSGAIPLLRGEAGNTLTGFNLDGSTPSLKITANKDGSGSFPVEMESLTLSSDKKSFTFKVPDTAKDGYLHLVVNGVAAVNNTNAYTESNMEESDTYGTAKHSDDRLVHIWRVSKEDTFKGSKNAIYPAMTKDSNGKLYASFSNYSNSDVYYSDAFTGNDAVIAAGGGTKQVLHVYDPPEETDITVTGSDPNPEVNVLYAANYHNGSARDWGNGTSITNTDGTKKNYPWNDTNSVNAGGIYLYDKDAPKIYRDYKGYRFELFTYDNELQQFKNIRVVRSGDNIYVVYYDRLTAAAKFAWVDNSKKPDTSAKALPWCVIDGNTDITDRECKVPDHLVDTAVPPDPPDNIFTFVSPNGSTYASPYILNIFEDGLSVSNAVWESIAVTVTKDGYPVVVYMDAATGSLRLARSTSKRLVHPIIGRYKAFSLLRTRMVRMQATTSMHVSAVMGCCISRSKTQGGNLCT